LGKGKLVRRLQRRFETRRHDVVLWLVGGGVIVFTIMLFDVMVR